MAKLHNKKVRPPKIFDLFLQKNGLPIHGLYIPQTENLSPERLAEYESWKSENSEKLDEIKSKQKEGLLEQFVLAIWILSKVKAVMGEDTLKDIKNEINLAGGREEGTEKGKANAKKKREIIKQAIDDLYKSGEGFQLLYKEIANRLVEKHGLYKYNSMFNLVKKFSPGMKAKYKSGQHSPQVA